MAGERYTEEFKIAAVKQVTDKGYSIADVAKRLWLTEIFLSGKYWQHHIHQLTQEVL